MRYFPSVLDEKGALALYQRLYDLIAEEGYGFWALELKSTGQTIGFTGLRLIRTGIPGAPFVEVGWRLAQPFWGFGYATEAGQASLEYAFNELEEQAIYAFTSLDNQPSRRVMNRLGMHDTGEEFDHPAIEEGHPLARQCLYKINRPA